MSLCARQCLEYFKFPFFEKIAFSGTERVKRKTFFFWKLLQIALGSIETCFHWIPTEIRTFGNFHFGSLTLSFPVTCSVGAMTYQLWRGITREWSWFRCSNLVFLKVDEILSRFGVFWGMASRIYAWLQKWWSAFYSISLVKNIHKISVSHHFENQLIFVISWCTLVCVGSESGIQTPWYFWLCGLFFMKFSMMILDYSEHCDDVNTWCMSFFECILFYRWLKQIFSVTQTWISPNNAVILNIFEKYFLSVNMF